ncbi:MULTISPECIES: hypothetical protein [Enterococcus]|uniref:hypothetical protein n=4 Tax=Enterococcus TaxID=1350 RepID=UPI0003544C98|nr:hypothetical protein [Enterococcus entomosocium]EPH88063.1 hypothetical protein D922_04049 [Enterococcus faecalis 06-MB-DW-09]UOO46323.1 hypothetical protein LLW22_03775 [Enterococcus casseliflavus]
MREKKADLTNREKKKFIMDMLPITLSILGSVIISYSANNVQLKISDNNRLLQEEQNALKKEELELTRLNSYPAFTFDVEENDNSLIYTLNRTKGEMNNVNFSMFEILTGQGSYNGKPLYIEQSIRYYNPDQINELKLLFPKKFDSIEVKSKINHLFEVNDIDASMDFLTFSRYYNVSYMNFEHEFKNEYYEVGINGSGKSIEEPQYNNHSRLYNEYYAHGGFSGKNLEEMNNDWVADKIYRIMLNPEHIDHPRNLD